MTPLMAAFLGVLQGITEFFPISSSGHLLLAEHFFGLPVEDLQSFDIVLHAGTLLALLVLFRAEWWQILRGFVLREAREGRVLFAQLVLATLPAAVAGLTLGDAIEEFARGELRIAVVTGGFLLVAVLLLLAEWRHRTTQPSTTLSTRQMIAMSLFQALALLPGVSRSGSTIASAMLLGAARPAAARFSFLMLAPVTAGAVLLTALNFAQGEAVLPALPVTLTGFAVSAVVSFLAAASLLALVRRHTLLGFGVYLVLAAAALQIWG
jgi:undecaprenyl-diphosphatase